MAVNGDLVCENPGYPTGGEIASFLGVDLARGGELAAAAEELVEGYAPAAPVSVKREAALRLCGYLHERKPGIVRSSETIGDFSRSLTYDRMTTSALRASGAMGLTSRWKVRRGGVI